MKKQRFGFKTIDKGKKEYFLFDFRNIEDRASRLQKEQGYLEKRFEDWQAQCNMLWVDINRLKKKMV